MNVLTDFGRRMRELRLKAGMTQEELASRSELDRSYMGAVERGEKNLSMINVAKIANALDVDLSYLFEDDRFSPRSVLLRREMKRPLEDRFIYDIDVMEKVIAWRIAGPLSEQDVQQIAQKIRNMSLLLNKGEIKLLVDNRSMVINGLPFVFSPQVNAIWEELQVWLLPYIKQVAVLCNSKLMKNQLDRLARRSGIYKISNNIFESDPVAGESEALKYLELSENRLLTAAMNSYFVVEMASEEGRKDS